MENYFNFRLAAELGMMLGDLLADITLYFME
jgi:hypothetical protein